MTRSALARSALARSALALVALTLVTLALVTPASGRPPCLGRQSEAASAEPLQPGRPAPDGVPP